MNFPWLTIGGYDFYEVLSALQKSIRRGLEEDTLFWATELYLSNYEAHAWNRLLVIASEDVGLADSDVFVQINTLYTAWKAIKKQNEAKLHFIHAVLILVRAPKSRIVDHALIVAFESERKKRDIPDWAIDKHTYKGRAMLRGNTHFFEEGAQLVQQILEDPYLERAKNILK